MKLIKNKFILAGILALTAAPQAFARTSPKALDGHVNAAQASIATAMSALTRISAARGLVGAEGAVPGQAVQGAHGSSPVQGAHGSSPVREDAANAQRQMATVLATLSEGFGVNGAALFNQITTAAGGRISPENFSAVLTVLSQTESSTLARIMEDAEYGKAAADFLGFYVATNKFGIARDADYQSRLAKTLDTATDTATLINLRKVVKDVLSSFAGDLPRRKVNEDDGAWNQRSSAAKTKAIASLREGITSINAEIERLRGGEQSDGAGAIAFLEGQAKLHASAVDALTRIEAGKFSREAILVNPNADALVIKEALFNHYAREALLKKGLTEEDVRFLLNKCGLRA